MDDDEVSEGGGLTFGEGPIHGADVGHETEEADMPCGGAAGVFGGVDHGGAVFFAVDEAGVVAPGGGLGAGGGFTGGGSAGGDPFVGVGAVGDGFGDAEGAEAGFDAGDVEGFAFEDGIDGGGCEGAGDVEAAGAIGEGDDFDGAGFREDGGGAALAVPGEFFDEGVGVEFGESDVALFFRRGRPVVGAVDVAVADPDRALVGMIGFGVFVEDAELVAGDFGPIFGKNRPEVGALPVGVVGGFGEAVGGEGLIIDGDRKGGIGFGDGNFG